MTAIFKKAKWYEIWIGPSGYGDIPIYILLLWEDKEGNFEVYDPIERHYSFFGKNYEDAMHYLTEDEFQLVEGRIEEELEVPSI